MKSKTEVQTLNFLASNEYWGRGILIGNVGDKIATAYFIMGRSENSRNRYFYRDDDKLVIAPYDESKVEDPSLIIYYPIKTAGKDLIITNGDQTDTIEDHLLRGSTFEEALRTRNFEPDAPNYTPRISGLCNLETGDFKLSILKNPDGNGVLNGRYFYEYDRQPGFGRFIHTYERNDNPLPSFEGEPWVVSLPDDFDEFTETIWKNLNEDNKISLCTLLIDRITGASEVRILNKRMGD